MKSLSIIGTIAMFLVGGGILAHGIPGAEAVLHACALRVHAVPMLGSLLEISLPSILSAVLGVIAGAVVLLAVTLVQRLLDKRRG
ncbi:MAG TPA: DUF808 family protein, partial [Methylophilaceae bacterium]|nr:DUF808 family protein [Methylophilaceae bacterium]